AGLPGVRRRRWRGDRHTKWRASWHSGGRESAFRVRNHAAPASEERVAGRSRIAEPARRALGRGGAGDSKDRCVGSPALPGRKRMHRLWLALLALSALSPMAGAQAPTRDVKDILPQFEKQVEEALRRTRVPGAAIVIVHKDRVVYVKGFGVRKVG